MLFGSGACVFVCPCAFVCKRVRVRVYVFMCLLSNAGVFVRCLLCLLSFVLCCCVAVFVCVCTLVCLRVLA